MTTARPFLTARRTAAVCALLGSPDDLGEPGVREVAERVRALLRSGAGADELAAGYDDLDQALRRAGDAGGLLNDSRSARRPASRRTSRWPCARDRPVAAGSNGPATYCPPRPAPSTAPVCANAVWAPTRDRPGPR